MKDSIDALELLTTQHDEVDALFKKIEESDDANEKTALFNELADKLAAHAAIEEKIFYPGVMCEETEDLLLESTEEHLSVKRVLADMLAMDVLEDRFDAKLTVLKEQVRHHARDEEEGELFSIVREVFTADELAALGNECMAMFEQLIERGEPRNNVSRETREAARLPSV